MLVLVDSREPQSIVDALSAVYGVHVSQLAAGDVNVPTPNGLLAIERKTPSDLLSSIGDGRLFDQARAMIESVRFPLIVVHGSLLYNQDDLAVADGRDTQWRGVSVRAAIRAVQWAGCAVEIVPTGQFVRAIQEAIKSASKERIPAQVQHAVTLETLDLRTDYLAGPPGTHIGPKRAMSLMQWSGGRLCEAFVWGSLLIDLSEDAMPEDWGRKTAQDFRDLLQLDPDESFQIYNFKEDHDNEQEEGSYGTYNGA